MATKKMATNKMVTNKMVTNKTRKKRETSVEKLSNYFCD